MVIDYPYAIEHKIRVIRYIDHKQYIDPTIEDVKVTLEVHYQWTYQWIGAQFIISGHISGLGPNSLSVDIHLLVTTIIFSKILYNQKDMCFLIDRMCYHLHFNIGINNVSLSSSLQISGLIVENQAQMWSQCVNSP